ncbi:MAG TPA: RNA-binding protein [Candidatus Woesearchaeota archaeon]|nr:RNA-binding protein [Candidatus Woesearchaeota archaeon]
MVEKRCTSCNADIVVIPNSVEFACPCGREKIIRCGKCRKISVKYKCKECGFEGP